MARLMILTFVIMVMLAGATSAIGHGSHQHSTPEKKRDKLKAHTYQKKRGKVVPKKRGKATPHAHHHSPWSLSLGVGVSTSYPLTKAPIEDEEAPEKSKQGNLHLLDEGHDHGGGEGSGTESTRATLSSFVSASVQYMISHSISLGVAGGYGFEGNLFDPSIFVAYTSRISKSISLPITFNASLPISESSRNNYKITTLSLSGGPQFRLTKALSMGALVGVSASWYSKTVIVTDHEETAARVQSPFLLDEGHDHGSGADTGLGADTGDREFNRYSAKLVGTYRLISALALGSAVGLSLVQRQFSDATWNFDATILQATYTLP